MKKLVLIVLLMTMLMGCSGHYLIDNPTEDTIKVYLDGQEYELAGKEYIKVKLEKGIHTVSSEKNGEKILNEEKFEISDEKSGLINPTKSEYIIYNIIYAKNSNIQSKFKGYEVDGREVYSLLGEPELLDSLFIEDRTQGKGNIDKTPPKMMKITGEYSFLMKIFRKDDFFEFYDEQMGGN